ncbi:MAG: hypothetical protein H7Z42_21470 [Roseiflexaceae bacterium]|nr:hypothetical protein [Roseiflexaceae bacterium]
MISIPTISKRGSARGYADTRDPHVLYVDSLEPMVAPATPIQRQALPSGQAVFAADIRFGASAADMQRFAAPERRLLPMPWEIGAVYGWLPEGEGVRLLARGKTSGFGAHNAVLTTTTEARLIDAPVTIAAELALQGQLAGARLQGRGDLRAARELLHHAPLGQRARWHVTLGEALIAWLRALLNHGPLTLRAEATDLTMEGVEDLRQIALAEWAHRVARAWFPRLESLALPAALAGEPAEAMPDLALDWYSGDLVTMRAVRGYNTMPRG